MNQAAAAHVASMRRVGIKTGKAIDYLEKMVGGPGNAGFGRKNMYNHVDAARRSQVLDGDAEAVLAYSIGNRETDPQFF